MVKRKAIPRSTQTAVLTKSRRRCAFCVFLDNSYLLKRGQISHIDHDKLNNAEENLVWLCQPHHDEYDSRPSQTKGLTERELIMAKSMVENFVIQGMIPDEKLKKKPPKSEPEKAAVSCETYKMRIPIYRVCREFVRSVLTDAYSDREMLAEFARSTEEAFFLFDESIQDYCHELYKMSIRLSATSDLMKNQNQHSVPDWSRLVTRKHEILDWFLEELNRVNARFLPYLKLGG
jgi:hypothetical protein